MPSATTVTQGQPSGPVSCPVVGASFPGTLQIGQSATFTAGGFRPGTPVIFSMTGAAFGQMTATADASCQVALQVTATPGDKPGSYTITASGTGSNGAAQSATVSYVVPAPPPGATLAGSAGAGTIAGNAVSPPPPPPVAVVPPIVNPVLARPPSTSASVSPPTAPDQPSAVAPNPSTATSPDTSAGAVPPPIPPTGIPDPIIALGENGPFLLGGQPPDVTLVTVPATVPVVRDLRNSLAADVQRNEAILTDYRDAQRKAQERAAALERLIPLLESSLSGAGGMSVDARQAYQVIYGTDAPTSRIVPGDRSENLDPLRADIPPQGTGASANESGALTLSDIERVQNDLAKTRSDLEQMPNIIKKLEDDVAAQRRTLQNLDSWLFVNEPLP